MQITLNINPKDLANQLNRRELLEFITKIDLEMAEVDFTLELIDSLIFSLKSDMSNEEIKESILKNL